MTPDDINQLVDVANRLQNMVQTQQHLNSQLGDSIHLLLRALAPPTHERASIDTLLSVYVKCREHLAEAAQMLSQVTDDPRPREWKQFLSEENPEMMYHRLMSHMARKEEELNAVKVKAEKAETDDAKEDEIKEEQP